MTTKQKHTKKTTSTTRRTAPKVVSKGSSTRTAAMKKKVTARKQVVSKKATQIKAKVKRSTKKAIVPNKDNGFRPHLVRIQGIIAVLLIAIMAQVSYSYFKTGSFDVLGRASNISVPALLEETNNERIERGVGALALNDELNQAAYLKAQDMMQHNYWAHVSPAGVQPWKWFADVQYNYSYAGENLAKNYTSADATVAAWMNSATHRANLLNDRYVDVGFAILDGELQGQNTTLVVALYGAPVSAALQVSTLGAAGSNFATGKVTPDTATPLSYFGSALMSLSPVSIAVIGLFAFVAIVGVVAHHYRKQLPKAWRTKWRMHHGMFTFVGMLVMGVLVIIATGGGSI